MSLMIKIMGSVFALLVSLVIVMAAPPSYCNLGYSDITPGILRNIILTGHYSNGMSVSALEKVDEKNYLARASNQSNTLNNYYLYNVGNDGLLATADDSAIYITNVTIPAYTFKAMTSGTGANTNLYWSTHNLHQFYPAFEVYSCNISNGTCASSLVASIPDPYEVRAIVPYDAGNRLYIAIEDASIASTFSGIFSCSLLSGMQDSCSLGLSSFTNHLFTNPPMEYSAFKDGGISASNVFFSVNNNTYNLPSFSYVSNYHASYVGNLLFFSKVHPILNLTDFMMLDTSSGQISTIYTDTTGIRPLLSTYDNNGLHFAYFRQNSGGYSQYIKHLSSITREVEVSRSQSYAYYGFPIGMTKDYRLISSRWNTAANRYIVQKSNCKA